MLWGAAMAQTLRAVSFVLGLAALGLCAVTAANLMGTAVRVTGTAIAAGTDLAASLGAR